jgi:two-component system cell cycle sensor histidine kinase/response regulator CckA
MTLRGPTEKRTILVADDEEPLLDIAGRVLNHAGYEVRLAVGGREAIETLSAHGSEIALVITDVVMPEVGAVEILAYLEDHELGHIPVICTSGYATSHVPAVVSARPGVRLLRKPYTLEELLGLVEELLLEVDSEGRGSPYPRRGDVCSGAGEFAP